MPKDRARKTRGSWWYGWVRYTLTHTRTGQVDVHDRFMITDWEYTTAGQAQRSADSLAGGLRRTFRGYTVTIRETGASRSEEP